MLIVYCLKNFTLVKQLHYRIFHSEYEIQLIYYSVLMISDKHRMKTYWKEPPLMSKVISKVTRISRPQASSLLLGKMWDIFLLIALR